MWKGGGAKESEVQTEGSHGEGGETSPSKQAQEMKLRQKSPNMKVFFLRKTRLITVSSNLV